MRVGILISGLLVAGACGGSDGTSTPPASHNVTVDVFTLSTVFSPNFSQIARGDTVRFTIVPSSNGEGHDVTLQGDGGRTRQHQSHSERRVHQSLHDRRHIPLRLLRASRHVGRRGRSVDHAAFQFSYRVTPSIVGVHVGNTKSRFGFPNLFCTISERMSR